MKPTGEQQAIIDAYTGGGNLVIEAGAGTGKTSTLKLLAAATPNRRGLYVAYNRAIAADARKSFPRQVTCATAHALAFRAVGKRYAHRLSGPRLPARQLAELLAIPGPLQVDTDRILAPVQIARLVMATVTRFCHAADPAIGRRHVPLLPGLDDPVSMAGLAEQLVPLAHTAWQDLCDPDGRLPFTHDHYLKLWQLAEPHLDCDFVLLDEAQDANPVVADIVERQTHAQRIMVGDRSQAIYAWRGAIDAMATFNADARLALSQSFRFGPSIAAEANKWLALLDAPLRLRGFAKLNSRVASVARPDAVLCRTNAEAVAQVMAATQTGRNAALVGGGADIRRLAEAAAELQAGQPTSHPELLAFRTWGEVQDYVDQDEAGSDLKVFVQLIDSYSPQVVTATVDRLTPEDRADVVISTAHKAKGREWPTVRIATDFREPKPANDAGWRGSVPRDEAMLAYVAVTRAREVLDRDGLAWVDRWLHTTIDTTAGTTNGTISGGPDGITITSNGDGAVDTGVSTIDVPTPPPAPTGTVTAGPDAEAPSRPTAAASRLVATLETVWAAIRRHHPEVPEVVVVVAAGSDGRGMVKKLGHFAAGRWQVTGTDRAEVLVSGEGLRRDPVEVLGTLLHEAAHGLATARNIVDTSRQGRYHNRRYETLAQEVGLTVEKLVPFGWAATTVPDPTAVRYTPQLEELAAALVLWRRAEHPHRRGPTKSNSGLALVCGCGRRIRAAPSTAAGPPILCGGCREPFQPSDPDREGLAG